MTISFREIPDDLRIPASYWELDTRLAAAGLPANNWKVLFFGQMTSSGTATANAPVQIYDTAEVQTKAGIGSMLHRMVVAALTANRRIAEMWMLPVADNGAGVAASGTFTFTASGLTSGILSIFIGDDTINVAILSTLTQNQVAQAVKDALDDHPELPVTAGVGTNVVTVTARHKGTLGNGIYLGAQYSATGLTTATVAMASGATDPSLTTAFAAIAGTQFDIIVFPWANSTALGLLSDHLETASDGENQIPGVGISALEDSVSNATAITTAINDGRILVALLEGTTSWPPEIAAAVASVMAAKSDPTMPLNHEVLDGVATPQLSDRFTRSELETLLLNGVCPLIVEQDEVAICRSISTYVTNAASAPDTALLDIQTIRGMDYVRRALKERFDLRFRQVKIADIAHTQNTTDPRQMKAEALDVLYTLERNDIIQGVTGNEGDILVERNESDASRVDVLVPSNIVRGLHVIAGRIRLTI